MKTDMTIFKKTLRIAPLLAAAPLLSGCDYVLLDPSGWVAEQQRDLLIYSTLLMLIIIVPVMIMGVYFPWRYRANRADDTDYDPEFNHSTTFEVFIWGVPVLIIAALGTLTYIYTHKLDPYRPLEASFGKPIEVEAVALDWKWLFIYPEQGVATVNELAIPAGRPVNLKLSASSMMNAFSVPALAGMVYAMPAMETKLHMIADKPGTFYGRSANYSGPGYSQMEFQTLAMTEGDFDAWVAKVRGNGTELDQDAYIALDKPSFSVPVAYYAGVMPDLFQRIVGLCVEPGKVCMHQMMLQDKQGGGGLEGVGNKNLYEYDRHRAQDGHGELITSQSETPDAETIAKANAINQLCTSETQISAAAAAMTLAPEKGAANAL